MRGEVEKKTHKKRDGEYDVTGIKSGAKVVQKWCKSGTDWASSLLP